MAASDPPLFRVVGVGHHEDPLASVRGRDGASRKYKRPRLVALACQVSQHVVERQVDEAKHVLTNDPAGPQLGNNAAHFRPEVTVILCASLLPGGGKGLAGEAARDQVNGADVEFKEGGAGEGANVVIDRSVRPVFVEDGAAERVAVAEGDGPDAPCPAGGKREATYAGEQVEVGERSWRI